MPYTASTTYLPLLAIAFLSTCTPCTSESPGNGLVFDPFTGTTTRSDLAVRNLNATIIGQKRALLKRPEDRSVRVALVDALLTRSQFIGTFNDLDLAVALAEEAVTNHPADSKALHLRARTYQAVHRFAEAENDLEAATALDGQNRSDALATLLIATGQDLDHALLIRKQVANTHPSFRTLTGYAAALAAVGRYQKADTVWIAALDHYKDVSPFPVAYVAFQRGVMWAEQAGQPERALPLYRQAVARLPEYTVANTHLAELEWAYGDTKQAITLLERMIPNTADPEPTGLLSEILANSEPMRANWLAAQAQRTYEDLFARQPNAFLDHGTEFFLGPGRDPQRALELARANLKIRGNSRAYEIALDAADATHDRKTMCSLAESARQTQMSVPLRKTLSTITMCF